MKRREWLALSAALVCVPASRHVAAQAGRVYRVGYLAPGTAESAELASGPFLRKMNALGYVEGRNLVWIRKFADNDASRLPALAAELIAANVDVIVGGGTPATHAARKATSTIPIVGFNITDPIASHMTTSLARPSANVTGATNMAAEIGGKRLDILRALVPKMRRAGFFFNLDNPANLIGRGIVEKYRNAGIEIIELGLRRPEEIEPAFRKAQARRADAVHISLDFLFTEEAKRMARLALEHRLPSIGGHRRLVEDGGLASFGASLEEVRNQSAVLVDRILKGAKPAELPFVLAENFELCLNRKTAAALGLTIPPELLVRADLVVE